MRILGQASVIVDAVDIEQVMIEDTRAKAGGRIFIVVAAAYAKESIKSLKLYLDRIDHCLVWCGNEHVGNIEQPEHPIRVSFHIRRKTAEEIEQGVEACRS